MGDRLACIDSLFTHKLFIHPQIVFYIHLQQHPHFVYFSALMNLIREMVGGAAKCLIHGLKTLRSNPELMAVMDAAEREALISLFGAYGSLIDCCEGLDTGVGDGR